VHRCALTGALAGGATGPAARPRSAEDEKHRAAAAVVACQRHAPCATLEARKISSDPTRSGTCCTCVEERGGGKMVFVLIRMYFEVF
jgi:hypothetical protein